MTLCLPYKAKTTFEVEHEKERWKVIWYSAYAGLIADLRGSEAAAFESYFMHRAKY
jgi:hypothetical protein